MRTLYIAGNWKMTQTIAQARELAQGVSSALPSDTAADVAVIPPFLAIGQVAEVLRGTGIAVGAQDVFWEKRGAFTGEISPEMLLEAGCTFALVGHSERRHVIGETDEIVRRKLDNLIDAGMDVILCVGELIEEREAGKTEERLDIQVRAGLAGLSRAQLGKVTIAYEPVWAIGTGKTATAVQAEQAHRFIRGLVTELFDDASAQALRIQYGGSVKPQNAAELMSQPNVDGALVGGASLRVESFVGIVTNAQ